MSRRRRGEGRRSLVGCGFVFEGQLEVGTNCMRMEWNGYGTGVQFGFLWYDTSAYINNSVLYLLSSHCLFQIKPQSPPSHIT